MMGRAHLLWWVVAALLLVGCSGSCEEEFWGRLWLDGNQVRLFGNGNQVFTYDWRRDDWAQVSFAGSEAETALAQAVWDEPRDLPLTVCVADSERCYRVDDDGEHQVLVSPDAGRSWQVAWAPPAGRLEFAQRHPGYFCNNLAYMGPYDLVVVGSPAEHTLFVAMGSQGALVRHADGTWQQQGVGRAQPRPWSTTDVNVAWHIVGREWLGGLLLGLGLLVLLSYVCLPRRYWPGWYWGIFFCVGLAVYLVVLLSLPLVAVLFGGLSVLPPFVAAWILGVLGPMVWGWLLFIAEARRRYWAGLAYVGWVGSGLAVGGLVCVAFWRWVTGDIAVYADAQVVGWQGGLVAALPLVTVALVGVGMARRSRVGFKIGGG